MFLDEDVGVLNCLGVAWPLPSDAAFEGRLMLVKPELTAVKPPELTAVKLVVAWGALEGEASFMETSRSESLLGPVTDACTASAAGLVGDSAWMVEGVWTLDRFIGLGAGLGVSGPPYSSSSCWWTPGFAIRKYSSYGQSHFWYEFFRDVDKDDMILPLYPKSRPISAHFLSLQTLSKPPRASTAFFNRYRSSGFLST